MEKDRKNPLARLLRFDEPDASFELLETERGVPTGRSERRERTEAPRKAEDGSVAAKLAENAARLKRDLNADINPDLILRRFRYRGRTEAMAVFLTGMADADSINDFILKPAQARRSAKGVRADIESAARTVFAMQETEMVTRWRDVLCAIEEGRTAVFLDGDARALIMDTRGFPSRSVGTANNEVVIVGPHEAFVENIRTNISLIRRIVKTDDLVCEIRGSGGKNNSRVAILYREGATNAALVGEVKKRLASVDTLMVLSAGTLMQLTEKSTFSPLPQSLLTERPDRVAAYLMQGSVAVLCEGSPQCSVMPATLFMLMSSGEDSYLRAPIGTLVRLVRYIGAFLSLVMPAYFLALALHHQGMLSGEVLSTVIASRSMVFLPLGVELLFLLIVFQLVREAGLSVPGAMGQSVGMIGGLILGQAAVAANIVSRVVLVIVALTGLGNFTIPDYETQLAAVYFRLLLVLSAWMGGLLGLFTAFLIATAYVCSMKSYGVPFVSPIAPKTYKKGGVLLRGRVKNHLRAVDAFNTREERA